MKEANFKETEIGKIPVDWEVKTLGELGQVIIGLTYSPKDVTDYGTLVLRSSNIQNNVLAFENNVFVNCELPERVIVKENDILICVRNGSKDLIGKCALIDKKREGVAFGAFMSIFRSDYNLFLINAFRSHIIQKQIDENLGATINQITNKNLNSFQIPLPPLAEQEKIAEVLSDTDLWIESTEALLAKKRQIKKGAMQKLLSPKEDWEVRKLGVVAEYRRGSFPQPYGLEKWYDEHNGMPFVQVFDVAKNMKLKPTTKQRISDLAKNYSVFVAKGNLVLTIQGSIGRIALTQYDSYVDRTLLIFTNFKIPMDKVYFMYKVYELFQIEKIKAPGGTIKTITKEELSQFIFDYPESLKTQQEIAEILSSMDLEIESLENRLQKARQIKQGMMQDLLTGKVRLVD